MKKKTAAYDKVFLAYDVRGVFPRELDKQFAYDLGRAFSVYSKVKEIAIAFDSRASSKKLLDGLAKGIQEQGSDAIVLGLMSTPGFYYANMKAKYAASIMITASHDPKQYNGFKMMLHGEALHRENGSLDVLALMKAQDFLKPKKKGRMRKEQWNKEYKAFLQAFVPKTVAAKQALAQLRVVIDQSCGTGFVETEVLKEMLPNAKLFNTKVSGNFPAHSPNPLLPESRKKLVSEAKKIKAHVGIIFDGDADRVCFIDEKAEFLRPDIILNILASELQSGKVVYDSRSSQSISELCDRRGLQALMSRVGRTNITELMRKESCDLAGEESGHYYFRSFQYFDNAGIAAIKLLSILARARPKELSELFRENHLYFNSDELNFKVKNQSKAFLLTEQAFVDAKRVLFLDGISIYYEDFWFNIRKSNTEPLMRVNIEAKSEAKLKEVIEKVRKVLSLAK